MRRSVDEIAAAALGAVEDDPRLWRDLAVWVAAKESRVLAHKAGAAVGYDRHGSIRGFNRISVALAYRDPVVVSLVRKIAPGLAPTGRVLDGEVRFRRSQA